MAQQREAAVDVDGNGGLLTLLDLPLELVSVILNKLEPRELGVVSCVSTLLYKLSSDNILWKKFCCNHLPFSKGYKQLFLESEYTDEFMVAPPFPKFLRGVHTDDVASVFILQCVPLPPLFFTSGDDSVVRMWHLENYESIASSKPLGSGVTAIVADSKVLVAATLSGFIHFWEAASSGVPHFFDLNACPGFRFQGHQTHVSSLALDDARIYTGSWDMTVRVWDRSLYHCVQILHHTSYVQNLALHANTNTLVTTSASNLYLWNIATGAQIAFVQSANNGCALVALVRSRSGDLLFTSGQDGDINMFKIMNKETADCHVIKLSTWKLGVDLVTCLAFDYPWLVAASSDGRFTVFDIRPPLKQSVFSNSSRIGSEVQLESPLRRIYCHRPLYTVGIGARRIVCNGARGDVVIWHFPKFQKKKGAIYDDKFRMYHLPRSHMYKYKTRFGRNVECIVYV